MNQKTAELKARELNKNRSFGVWKQKASEKKFKIVGFVASKSLRCANEYEVYVLSADLETGGSFSSEEKFFFNTHIQV